jgi:hypothetical protein
MTTINTVDKLNKYLDKIVKELPKLRSDVASEQVVNNQKMEDYLTELREYEQEIYEIVKQKLAVVTPFDENPAVSEKYEESEKYRAILKLTGKDEDFEERFGFDRTVYEIGHAKDVDRVNEVLKDFVIDMEHIGIKLVGSNFNYSTFTQRYMDAFFENMNNSRYLLIMKNVFNSIYWECPLLLTHLELCVKNLITNNKKVIIRHINTLLDQNLKEVNSTREDIHDLYTKTRIEYEDMRLYDPYNILDYFDNNRQETRKFYTDSDDFKAVLNTVADANEYIHASRDDKRFMLKSIKELYFDVLEYQKVEKFKKLFKFLADIYENRDNIKDNLKEKQKEISKLEKEKAGLDRKVHSLVRKRNALSIINAKDRINDINDKIKEIEGQLEIKIGEIKKNHDELNFEFFQNTLCKTFNQSTSLFEAAEFFSKFYGILYNQVSADNMIERDEIEPRVDEFRHIQYMARSTIMKSVPFTDTKAVKALIEKKYSLYNMKFELAAIDDADFSKFLDNLDTLVKYGALEENVLDIETCDMILKFKDYEELKIKRIRENLQNTEEI